MGSHLQAWELEEMVLGQRKEETEVQFKQAGKEFSLPLLVLLLTSVQVLISGLRNQAAISSSKLDMEFAYNSISPFAPSPPLKTTRTTTTNPHSVYDQQNTKNHWKLIQL